MLGVGRFPCSPYIRPLRAPSPTAESEPMVKPHAPTLNGNGAVVNGHDPKAAPPSELDFALPAMDALSEELNRLAAINADLVGRLRGAAAAVSTDKTAGAESAD